MTFPKLYKLTAIGKIQEWEISTEDNKIIILQGQQNGKKQRYEETISKGKNIGKANETTPIQQAEAEAQSKWDKRYNKDYRTSIEECNKKVKVANTGGYLPMLAQDYKKHAERHLRYFCFVQPKLDGIRCIATKTEEGVKLWFRSGKEITTMNHIVEELNKVMMDVGDILDGELYAHGEEFNEFAGAIRANKNLNPEITREIKYHVYDCPRICSLKENRTFEDRFSMFDCSLAHNIVKVYTKVVSNFAEAMSFYKACIFRGYEGIMFRNMDMPYEQKRSYNLLKYKEFIDEEFTIIGAEEGKGSLAKHVGSFICKIEAGRELKDIAGKTFKHIIETTVKAKMKGKLDYLKYLFNHPEEYMGKPLTIKYQTLSEYGIPRFPVGKAIRFDK